MKIFNGEVVLFEAVPTTPRATAPVRRRDIKRWRTRMPSD